MHSYDLLVYFLILVLLAATLVFENRLGTEQNRTDYLFDVNYTVSSQSNTIIIYISRSQMFSEYLNQVVVLI